MPRLSAEKLNLKSNSIRNIRFMWTGKRVLSLYAHCLLKYILLCWPWEIVIWTGLPGTRTSGVSLTRVTRPFWKIDLFSYVEITYMHIRKNNEDYAIENSKAWTSLQGLPRQEALCFRFSCLGQSYGWKRSGFFGWVWPSRISGCIRTIHGI